MVKTPGRPVVGFASMAVVAIGAAAWWFSCAACAAARPEMRHVELGVVDNAADKPGPTALAVGGLPGSFVVGGAGDLDLLLKERARLHAAYPAVKFAVVIDGAGLDALRLTTLSDRLVEASLDEGPPLLLDRLGDTARSLRDGAQGAFLVRLNAESKVVTSLPLTGSGSDAEKAALGVAP